MFLPLVSLFLFLYSLKALNLLHLFRPMYRSQDSVHIFSILCTDTFSKITHRTLTGLFAILGIKLLDFQKIFLHKSIKIIPFELRIFRSFPYDWCTIFKGFFATYIYESENQLPALYFVFPNCITNTWMSVTLWHIPKINGGNQVLANVLDLWWSLKKAWLTNTTHFPLSISYSNES